MKPAFLQLDTLDDRREIHQLLARLSPSRRLAFLRWCCRSAKLPNSRVRPTVPPNHSGNAMEIYFDLFALSANYDFSLDRALTVLVGYVKGRGLPV